MKEYLVCDTSLRFSRAVYGSLALIAYLTQNHWLVLVVGILMLLGVFSLRLNVPYQFCSLTLNRLFKKSSNLVRKESGELSFACGMGGTFLLIAFLLLYFEIIVGIAWSLVLVMTILMFLASFLGLCLATVMYAVLKNAFRSQ